MNRIRQLREAKGMQQKDLSVDLKVSQPTISDWESGRKTPSAKSVAKLADYFGVSIDYLLGRDTDFQSSIQKNGNIAKLKILREQSGETQAELANVLGITRAAYTNIENGKREPDYDTIKKLANHFSVTTDYLLGNEENLAVAENDKADLPDEVLEIAKVIASLPPEKKKTMLNLIDLLKDGKASS